jgi:hypothetical protein
MLITNSNIRFSQSSSLLKSIKKAGNKRINLTLDDETVIKTKDTGLSDFHKKRIIRKAALY